MGDSKKYFNNDPRPIIQVSSENSVASLRKAGEGWETAPGDIQGGDDTLMKV